MRQQVHAEILGTKKMEVMTIVLCLLWKIEHTFFRWLTELLFVGDCLKKLYPHLQTGAMNIRSHLSNNLPHFRKPEINSVVVIFTFWA